MYTQYVHAHATKKKKRYSGSGRKKRKSVPNGCRSVSNGNKECRGNGNYPGISYI